MEPILEDGAEGVMILAVDPARELEGLTVPVEDSRGLAPLSPAVAVLRGGPPELLGFGERETEVLLEGRLDRCGAGVARVGEEAEEVVGPGGVEPAHEVAGDHVVVEGESVPGVKGERSRAACRLRGSWESVGMPRVAREDLGDPFLEEAGASDTLGDTHEVDELVMDRGEAGDRVCVFVVPRGAAREVPEGWIDTAELVDHRVPEVEEEPRSELDAQDVGDPLDLLVEVVARALTEAVVVVEDDVEVLGDDVGVVVYAGAEECEREERRRAPARHWQTPVDVGPVVSARPMGGSADAAIGDTFTLANLPEGDVSVWPGLDRDGMRELARGPEAQRIERLRPRHPGLTIKQTCPCSQGSINATRAPPGIAS